jgi:hypothetical protein
MLNEFLHEWIIL